MPLLDHFRTPLRKEVPWTGFSSEWASCIARELNRGLLPPGYRAILNVQLAGGAVEIDVATLRDRAGADFTPPGNGWNPPAPQGTATVDIAGLDTFEVQVIYDNGEINLIAAVELISPTNKDRPDARRAFALKCANYLEQRTSVVIVDVVTERHANLHEEVLGLLQLDRAAAWRADTDLYAVAYRPRKENSHTRIDWRTEPLAVGVEMPRMPLWIGIDLCVPVDLEKTYTAACEGLRIPMPAPGRNGA